MIIGAERELLRDSTSNPKAFFKCEVGWPCCKLNFTKQHEIVEEFVFKVENYDKLEIF